MNFSAEFSSLKITPSLVKTDKITPVIGIVGAFSTAKSNIVSSHIPEISGK